MSKQKSNELGLWGRNMWATFCLPLRLMDAKENYGLGTGFVLLGLVALMPLTVTVGAGIKTAVDIATRDKLDEDEVEALKAAIEALDAEAFNRVAAKLRDLNPRSHGSRQLRSSFFPENGIERGITNAGSTEGYKIQEERLNAAKDRLGELAKNVRVYVDSEAEFTEEEERRIEEAKTTAKSRLELESKQMQRANLIAYLSNPDNAGKRTQHIIKAAVEAETSAASLTGAPLTVAPRP
ncbi:MAG TPA: hypothetical protein VD770_02175 [Coxiellaceae bacterium]|nr:hypothetical protein [Coxiellaceae bacterium]